MLSSHRILRVLRTRRTASCRTARLLIDNRNFTFPPASPLPSFPRRSPIIRLRPGVGQKRPVPVPLAETRYPQKVNLLIPKIQLVSSVRFFLRLESLAICAKLTQSAQCTCAASTHPPARTSAPGTGVLSAFIGVHRRPYGFSRIQRAPFRPTRPKSSRHAKNLRFSNTTIHYCRKPRLGSKKGTAGGPGNPPPAWTPPHKDSRAAENPP
jgi:hypothetical protein